LEEGIIQVLMYLMKSIDDWEWPVLHLNGAVPQKHGRLPSCSVKSLIV